LKYSDPEEHYPTHTQLKVYSLHLIKTITLVYFDIDDGRGQKGKGVGLWEHCLNVCVYECQSKCFAFTLSMNFY